jgi:hypothetical protein
VAWPRDGGGAAWLAAQRCIGGGLRWRPVPSRTRGPIGGGWPGLLSLALLRLGSNISKARVPPADRRFPLPSFAAPALCRHASVPDCPSVRNRPGRSSVVTLASGSKLRNRSDGILCNCLRIPPSRLTAHCLWCHAIYIHTHIPVICPFVRLVFAAPSLTHLKPVVSPCIIYPYIHRYAGPKPAV